MQVLNNIYADVAEAHTRVQYIDVSTSLGSADGGFSPAVNGFADEFHLNALGYCNLFRHTPGLTDAFGCTTSSTADPGCTLAPTPAAVTSGPTVVPSPAPTTESLACGVCTYSVCVSGCSSFNQFGHDRFSFPCNSPCAHTCNPDAGPTSACGSSSSGPDSPTHHGHTDCELYCHTVTDGRPTELTTTVATRVDTTSVQTTSMVPAVYSLRQIGSCVSPSFAFIETAADCSAAARSLGLPDVSATTISTAVNNNRNEVPHGCYFYAANPGNFRLFFNPVGLLNANTDTDRQSVCIGRPTTVTVTEPPTGAGACVDQPLCSDVDASLCSSAEVQGICPALCGECPDETTTAPPPTNPPTSAPVTSQPTSSATSVATTSVPTTNACPRNCGTTNRGGGTCRSNGRCTSCNENRLRANGRCVQSLSCKGRRIQTGVMTGQGCRCLQDQCHFCSLEVSGDTCRVVSPPLPLVVAS